MTLDVDGTEYEYKTEAEAGIGLLGGTKWWGSYVRYRRVGIADRRWTKFTLVDAHPFDTGAIETAIKYHALGKAIDVSS